MVGQTRFSEPRRGSLRRATGYAFGVAAVVAVVMIGNLRAQASEAAHRVDGPALVDTSALLPASADWRLTAVSSEPAADERADGVEVVPAIYARNPDVRFVYDRHVSKWM